MKRVLLTAVAALAAIYAVGVTWRQNERAAGLDFYIYFVAGQIARRADIDNIYAPEVQARIGEEYFERAQRSRSELRKYDAQRRRRLDNVSSPFLYATLRWVSGDYDQALRQYRALVLFAFVAGFLLIARAVRLSWASSLFLLAAALLYYRGFEADLRVGNVNSLQLLAVGVALSVPPFLAGTVIGMLLLFKPNLLAVPLLLIVARVASRDWKRLRREIAGGVVGALIAVVVVASSYGSLSIWIDWVTAANQFWHRLPTRMERNVTPALALFREHGDWISYAIAAVLTAIASASIWRGRRMERRRDDDLRDAERPDLGTTKAGSVDALIVGMAILVYLVSATVVWLHYMVLAIPVALALLRWRSTAVVSLFALAMIAEEPFEMFAGRAAAPVESILIAPALVGLFACAAWKLSHPSPRAV